MRAAPGAGDDASGLGDDRIVRSPSKAALGRLAATVHSQAERLGVLALQAS